MGAPNKRTVGNTDRKAEGLLFSSGFLEGAAVYHDEDKMTLIANRVASSWSK